MVALVKCLKAPVFNVYCEWIPKQETGSQLQACGHNKPLKVRSERRIAKVVQSNRRATVLSGIARYAKALVLKK
ncbi:hypothetical protein TNCV_3317071 [Trichonephila clavipes]|nr:hypothetical protein TNCV_3317071 [Trichonephila clavipes]